MSKYFANFVVVQIEIKKTMTGGGKLKHLLRLRKKISRVELVRWLRHIVGDGVLYSTIKQLQHKVSSIVFFFHFTFCLSLPDPNFDALISALYPDIDRFEKESLEDEIVSETEMQLVRHSLSFGRFQEL
ncbi:uncharacterized protein LOC144554525 [Carex rostrata]